MVSHMDHGRDNELTIIPTKKKSASMLSFMRCLLCGIQTICHVYDIQILGAPDPHQVRFVVRKCDGEMSQKPNREV